jgi:glycosyltransferase involved in cell wall biosynthesis
VRAGFFSPLPPAPTGVADYSAALLRAMRSCGSVAIGDESAPALLYHIGNNQLHRRVYELALRKSGVVVLHDAVLHHFFLGSLAEPEYVSEFVYNYGAWAADHARTLWAHRATSASDPVFFQFAMLRRIAESARAVVVHNPAARGIVRAHAPKAKVYIVPHIFEPPPEPSGAEVERLRQRYGLSPSTTLFGVFGHMRDSKRIGSVLRAFDIVRRSRDAALLVAGDFVSGDYERSLGAALSAPGIIRVPLLPEPQWWLHASATDACINLRYPAAGETSGIAIRMMGIGKPVLVTSGAENEDIPDAACIRIDHGLAEIDMLAEFMTWISLRPGDSREMGSLARAHVREHHEPEGVARLFWNVLEESCGA